MIKSTTIFLCIFLLTLTSVLAFEEKEVGVIPVCYGPINIVVHADNATKIPLVNIKYAERLGDGRFKMYCWDNVSTPLIVISADEQTKYSFASNYYLDNLSNYESVQAVASRRNIVFSDISFAPIKPKPINLLEIQSLTTEVLVWSLLIILSILLFLLLIGKWLWSAETELALWYKQREKEYQSEKVWKEIKENLNKGSNFNFK